MKRSQFSILLGLLVVFLSGTVVGGFGHYLYASRATVSAKSAPKSPEEYRRKYVSEMETRLKLDQAQMKQLNEILDVTRARFKEFREKTKPEVKAIQQEQTDKIRSILNPSQQDEYEKMRQEREAKRKEAPGGGC